MSSRYEPIGLCRSMSGTAVRPHRRASASKGAASAGVSDDSRRRGHVRDDRLLQVNNDVGVPTFNGEDRERYLDERVRGIVAEVADLKWQLLGIIPRDLRGLCPVTTEDDAGRH
jgi:hypothetical protein